MKLADQWIKLSPKERLYHRPYPVIALTGGIASGKSTLLDFFKTKKIPTISADQLIKEIYKKKSTLDWLKLHASQAVKEEQVCFKTLRQKVFSDATFKNELETFLYKGLPHAFQEAEAQFKEIPWLIYEIPLLFERKLEEKFDVIIVSWISREEQKRRLLIRDPQTDEQLAEKIISDQISIDEKKIKADIVFDNSKEISPKALEQLWETLITN
ncbi:MAG: dephospho-CoA kinase [Bacteriovoracaceae bacterium]|nr:dephospho-CoA kinase [Bacteriovoracaceae bacterium]